MPSATNGLPGKLYHGSGYYHKKLMPGFARSGELVEWDETESNKFLYATTDMAVAIELGFASAIEAKFHINRFQSKNGSFIVTTDDPGLVFSKVKALDVYLYTIEVQESDGWMKNNNKHNNLDTEYKTDGVITRIIRVQRIDIGDWLKDKKFAIKYEDKNGRIKRPTFTSW